MIVRHGTLWAIAVLVLLASVSFSESVKLRKPRKRTTARTPYQQSRIGSVIIRVMHKYSDDELTRSASTGCTNGNCRNAHNKFNFEPVNEAMSEKDNFLSDEESLRYVVHPEKYEHFVMRKNTGHANRYKRNSTFSELHSSNTNDRTMVNRDASEVSKNVNKGNFTKKIYRLPLYKTVSLNPFNRYTKNLSKSLSEASRTRRSLTVDYSSQRNDSDSGDASEVSKNINKGNFTRVPLYRIVSLDGLNRYTKNLESLSSASRTRRSLTVDYSSQGNDSDSGDASEVSKNVNKGNFTRVPLYRIVSLDGLNRYTKNLESLSSVSRTRRSLTVDYSSQRNDSNSGDVSEVSKNVNKGNFTRVPLYRIVSLDGLNRYTKNLESLSSASRTRRSLTVDYSSQGNDSDSGDASEVSKNVNKENFTRVPLYRIVSLDGLNRYTKNLESLSSASRTRRSLTVDYSSQGNDSDSGDASKVSKNVNKGNFTRVPLYRIVSLDGLNRYTKNLESLSSVSRTRRSLTVDYSSQGNDSDSGDASEVSKNVNKGNFTRVPLYRIVSLDGLNRYTKNLESLSSVSRTRRSLTVDYSSQRNDSNSGDVSEVSKNVNKGNFTRVPLYKIVSLDGLNRYRKNSKFLSEVSRTRRSLAIDDSSRRNDNDYYAQRKAVMDRYYARQREINARYANRTSTTPRKYNNVSPTSNVTLFNLGRIYSNKDSTRDTATFLHPSTKIDPIYSNESRYNKIPTELDSRRNFVPEIEPGFKSETDLSQMRSSGNSERNALDYLVTPTPCTNLSSNGTFAPKTRSKQAQNYTSETEQNNEDFVNNSADKNNTEGNLRWGKCEGKIVYQHNLLLGLRGPSNLDALFEVIIQGPVCITCVEALRYNETRATVALDSGGRGYEYAKLRLQGYENEGFSYIIKVWGINKIGEGCDK